MERQLAKRPSLLIYFIFVTMTALLFTGSCSKDPNNLPPIQTPPTTPTTPSPPIIPNDSNVVYTQLLSDSVIISATTKWYDFDLNNDGVVDFVFTETAGPIGNCRGLTGVRYAGRVRPARESNNAIIFTTYNNIHPLDSASVVGADAVSWSVDTLYHFFFSKTIGLADRCNPGSGPWQNGVDKYLGLKIVKDDRTYYGWARLCNCINGISLTLKDYAYNKVPGKPILAGQTK